MSMSLLGRFTCTAPALAGAGMFFAAPAYADVSGFPGQGGAILAGVIVVGIVCIAVVGVVSWWVLRAIAKRRREREAAEHWTQLKAAEGEERR
jgi:hypothetical protein